MWLPDRPGTLGQVAGRVGAVDGDVVGLEIMERGGGTAIDDITVLLSTADDLPRLIREIERVENVRVEDARRVTAPVDTELAVLGLAGDISEARSGAIAALVDGLKTLFNADWAAALRLQPIGFHHVAGETPNIGWLAAYVEGTRHLPENTDIAPDDISWTRLASSGLTIAIGRDGRPLRWRERRHLAELARIADSVSSQTRRPGG